MAEKMKLPVILILLAFCLGTPTPGIADGSHDQITEPGNPLPNNTIRMRASARIFHCC